jgi:putative ABC transport system ATP-binding protein
MTQKNLVSKYATHKLLHFLVTLFEQPQSFETLFHLTQKNITNWLVELPLLVDLVDLNTQKIHFSIEDALHHASPQTPVVGVFKNSVFVFYGFSSGRFRVVHIYEEQIDEHLFSLNETLQFLNENPKNTFDFLMIQPKKPLEQAVSHDHHHHLTPFERLVAMLRPERTDLWLILGLGLGSGLLALSAPIAVQAVVNTVAMGGMGQPLVVLCTILFVFLAFLGAIFVLESYLAEMIQRRLFVRLATDLAYRLPKMRRHLYDTHRGAELINRFFDVQTVQKSTAMLVLDGVRLLMQTIAGLILLAFYHPFLLSFDIALLLTIAFIMFVLGRNGVKTSIAESKAKYALVDWLEVIAENKTTFKAATGEQFAQEKIDILSNNYLTEKESHYRVLLRQIIGSVTLYAIANTGLLLIGGDLVIEKQLTLGQLVAAELIVSTVLASLIKFGKHLESFYDLLTAVDKIGHLLDLPLENEKGQIVDLPPAVSLTAKNVSFHYLSMPAVLNNVNFQIAAGEKIAFLGQASCGKSTLCEVLFGLREAQKGDIEIEHIKLKTLNLPALRERIALLNEIEIIDGTLLENVLLGRENIDHAQVEKLLNDLELLEKLHTQFGKTLFLPLSEAGSPLSKTQQRLLMLARVTINQPALLIIDSFLDELDEKTFDCVLNYLFKLKTTVLIFTQKPQIASRCERVIKMEGMQS